MSDAIATATKSVVTTIFLDGLIKLPRGLPPLIIIPLTHNEICAILRANLSRRIVTGSWNETEED